MKEPKVSQKPFLQNGRSWQGKGSIKIMTGLQANAKCNNKPAEEFKERKDRTAPPFFPATLQNLILKT